MLLQKLCCRNAIATKPTFRAVVAGRAFDGLIDVHHSLAVVTVVALRAELAVPAAGLVLVVAARAEARRERLLQAVVAHRAQVRLLCALALRAVVATRAVACNNDALVLDDR